MPTLKLFWENVQNAVSYNIYYNTTPGVTIGTGILIQNVTDVVYYHKSLQEATSYYYIVVAVDPFGNLGPPSIEFSAVTSAILSFDIAPQDTSISVGSTQQYQAIVSYSDSSARDVTSITSWDTDNHSIATIDTSGLLTALAFGSANVTAQYLTYDAYTSISTTHALLSINITPSSPTIDAYGIQQFTATGHYDDLSTLDITNSVTWSSSNTGVATIDETGLATSTFHGTTSIGASLGLITATPVVLTVVAVLQSISVTPSSATTATTQQFIADGYYNDGSEADITNTVTWMSSNNSIATIDSSGFATGVSSGSVTISAELSSIDGYASLLISAVPSINLVHWVMANAGVTKDISNHVTAWNDQSGHSTNWAQDQGNVTWVDNQLNGMPVLRGGATNTTTYLSQSAFISGSSDGEAIMIIKSLETGTNYGWGRFGSDPSLSNHYAYVGTDIYDGFGLTARQGPFTGAGVAAETQAYGIFNLSVVSGVLTVRLNNSIIGVSGVATPGWTTTFNLFSMSSTGGFSFHGDIAELLIYDGALSSGNRTTVYNYLNTKWALGL